MDDARLCGQTGKFDRGGGGGEVDHAFRIEEGCQRIAGHGNAECARTSHFAGVAANQRRTCALDSGVKLNALHSGNQPDQRLAHTTASAGNNQFHSALSHSVSCPAVARADWMLASRA